MDEKYLVPMARQIAFLQLQIRLIKAIFQFKLDISTEQFDELLTHVMDRSLKEECGNVASLLKDFIEDAEEKGLTLDKLIEISEKKRSEKEIESERKHFDQLFREMWGKDSSLENAPPKEPPSV